MVQFRVALQNKIFDFASFHTGWKELWETKSSINMLNQRFCSTLFPQRNPTLIFYSDPGPGSVTPCHVHHGKFLIYKVHLSTWSTVFPKRNSTFHGAFLWRLGVKGHPSAITLSGFSTCIQKGPTQPYWRTCKSTEHLNWWIVACRWIVKCLSFDMLWLGQGCLSLMWDESRIGQDQLEIPTDDKQSCVWIYTK